MTYKLICNFINLNIYIHIYIKYSDNIYIYHKNKLYLIYQSHQQYLQYTSSYNLFRLL